MKVLVCGGRDYADRELVYVVLDRIHGETPIEFIIQGEADGADALARDWAVSRKVALIGCHADWKKHGRAAGPMRNQDMLDRWEPDVVIAFPGGAGTADMVRRARRAGVPVEHAAREAKDAVEALRREVSGRTGEVRSSEPEIMRVKRELEEARAALAELCYQAECYVRPRSNLRMSGVTYSSPSVKRLAEAVQAARKVLDDGSP